MSFYRIILGITGLTILFSLLALPSSCSQDKTEYVLKFSCTTTINVTDTGVSIPDAFVCANNKVTWNANGHIFFVFFKNACPFQGGCKEIDNQKPTSGPMNPVTKPTIFDYGIVVDGKPFDPHIIGGGN